MWRREMMMNLENQTFLVYLGLFIVLYLLFAF